VSLRPFIPLYSPRNNIFKKNLLFSPIKVLSVLDAVHMLFSDPGSPFIILLAIDPHVITKAIELNLNRAFSDTSIGGNAYLRNIVHLPFFLQGSDTPYTLV
jgi:hypothetical protein